MKIYWDYETHEFLKSSDNSQVYQSFEWIVRDVLSVELYLVVPNDTTGDYDQGEAPAGYTPKFGLKADDYTGNLLVYTGVWTLSGSGTSAKYLGTIDLDTTELIAKLAASEYVDLVGEFVLENASGKHRDSTQITIRIYADVVRDTDSVPHTLPGFWEEYTDTASGKKCIRIKNSDGETLMELKPTGV